MKNGMLIQVMNNISGEFSRIAPVDSISTDKGTFSSPLSDTTGIINNVLDTIKNGFEGNLIPYRLGTDDMITGILLFCFFLSAFVLTFHKRVLLQQAKDYFHLKERSSIFSDSMGIDIRFRILLVFQTCILLAICFFDYFNDSNVDFPYNHPSLLIVGIYTLACSVYYLFKWLLYTFLVWIFFDKTKGKILIESYFFITSGLGFGLLPIALLAIYFDLSNEFLLPILLGFVIFSKIMLFYKCLKLFFDKLYGGLSLIVYFCALEIMPCFILYKALLQINNLLLIKL